MLVQGWSNIVRNWLFNRTRNVAQLKSSLRRRGRQQNNLRVENLEDRCLLSAISISDVTVVEGNLGVTNAVFTVSLDVADGVNTQTVDVTTADDTATSPADYIANTLTLTFLPGVTTQTFTVAVNGDTIDELDETFFANLSNPTGGATIADGQGVGTITDDDVAPTVSIDDVTIVEGDAGVTNAVFTVTLSEASGQIVTVLATPTDGTATSPLDYLGLPTVLTFAPGVTTQTFTVVVDGDTIDELDETFTVDLTVPVNATIADAQGLGTITDDDAAPTISIDDVTVVEGDAGVTNAVFTVTLSAASGQIVTVLATPTDGTATSPLDYLGLPAVLTFAPGVTTQTFTVAINGDTIDEGDETFTVDLTVPVNATIADAQGLGTITDDDVAPTVSIDDVTVVEGDAGVTNAVFTVTLSAASGQIVTVLATPTDGTATSPLDYLGLPAVLTFAPGVTTQTFTVAINGDTIDEVDETFTVDLTVPTNATIADAQGVGTIIDDDLAPTVSIDDVTVVEGDAGVTNAVFTVTLSEASGQIVTVLATPTDGTATSPLDYLGLPAVLTFAPGVTTQTFTVAINGDTIDELDETFTVDLTAPVNATIADAQGVGTITDDDAAPTVSIDDVTVVEGDAGVTNAVFTVTLSAASGQTVTVLATPTDGTATSPLDYLGLPAVLTFAPGVTTQTFTVAINGDTIDEADETFTVDLTVPVNATIADAQGLGTITDDDVAPTVSIDDVTVVEGDAGVTNAVFTVTLSAASGQTVTVLATPTDGTATSPLDYLGLPAVLTFAPGVTTQTFTVAVNGDTIDELDETFTVDLTVPVNATIADAQGVGTITDDDLAPTISIDDVTIVEGDAGVTNAVFTVTLSAASGQIVTVLATPTDGTATSPLDYLGVPVTVTFAPGETTQTVTVAINGDTIDELDETFTVELTAPVNATIADAQGVGTITDDDTPPTVSIDDVTVVEGDAGVTNAVFTVTLSAASGQTVTVLATPADGTATSPLDYLGVPVVVTFAPGETTQTVTVPINGDTIDETNETFFINLTAPTNATIADAQGLGTITDDDVAPTVSIDDVTVVEGNAGVTNAVFTVTLSAASGQTVTVLATPADGTATSPLDYLGLPVTVTFAPGETTKTVTVAVNGDAVVEPNETFFINLTAPTNATLADAQALGTITNDDSATVSIVKIADGAETDSPTSGTFRVTLSAASATDTVINYTISGTASAGNDYTALSGTVTIPAGQLSADISVVVLNDAVVEDTETVIATLTGFGSVNPSITLDPVPANVTATVNITDNDPIAITSPSSVSVVENTPATTVVLDVNATPVPGRTFTYTLTGPDAALFTIDPATGEIRFVASPDFDVPADQGADNVYNVTVTVTGDFTPPRSTSQDLTITVTPANDTAPVFVDASPTFDVPENSPNGTVVGTVTAVDSDAPPQAVTYSIVSGNESGAFAIDPITGVITVADSTLLDFEGTNQFSFTVRATDNGSPTPQFADAVVTVNVTNVIEGPTLTIPNTGGIYQIGQRAIAVAPDATFEFGDVANPDYTDARLVVSIVAGASRSDRLSVYTFVETTENSISVRGRKVLFGREQIGRLQRGRGSRDLVVDLYGNATTEAVEMLIQRVNFRARTDAGTTRTVNVQVTNIGGTDSNVETRDITVLPRSR